MMKTHLAAMFALGLWMSGTAGATQNGLDVQTALAASRARRLLPSRVAVRS